MSAIIVNLLTQTGQNLLDLASAIKTYIDRKSSKLVVDEYTTVAAGEYKQYDLENLVGANPTSYNLKAAKVIVRIKDVDATSPTYNGYINSEAAVTHAIVTERYLRVYNYFDEAADLYVCVDVPRT